MSTATALPRPVARRRIAVVLLAGAIAGGIGASLPSTDAQAYPKSDPWCQIHEDPVNCQVF